MAGTPLHREFGGMDDAIAEYNAGKRVTILPEFPKPDLVVKFKPAFYKDEGEDRKLWDAKSLADYAKLTSDTNLAQLIGYPEQWDTVNYPTLEDALEEVRANCHQEGIENA